MSSPEIGASTARIMYYLSIICARRSIYIANPYFLPDAAAIDALVEAKSRGVDVRIMVAGIHNDNWLARQNSVRLFGPLLRAGIEILEYNRTMLHHKTMVVDSRVGDHRHDELRQPIVRAQRREQRLLLRSRVRAIAPRDVRGGHQRPAIAWSWPVGSAAGSGSGAGSVRGIPGRADLTRGFQHAADPTSL